MGKGRYGKPVRGSKGSRQHGRNHNDDPDELHDHKFFKKGTKVHWLERGVLHPVSDQGKCQSCVGKCVCGVLAAVHYIEHQDAKELLEFADQEMVDCATKDSSQKDSRHCRASNFKEAYDYIKENGVFLADVYGKYKEKKEDCRQPKLKGSKLKIAGFREIPPGGDVKSILVQHPLSAAIVLTDNFESLDKEKALQGIYEPPADKKFVLRTLDDVVEKKVKLHAVTIIDWGVDEEGIPFYIVQNTWGAGWAYFGYAKVSIDSLHFISYPYGTRFV